MTSFEELEAWKSARILRKDISQLIKIFPSSEQYKLTNQMIRASRSVTANIAEGHGRFHYQENIQFCRQARGSLMETKDHLICAFDCKYLNDVKLCMLLQQYDLILQKRNGYISYLQMLKSKAKL